MKNYLVVVHLYWTRRVTEVATFIVDNALDEAMASQQAVLVATRTRVGIYNACAISCTPIDT
jgi:hypothetical protein